MLEMLVVVCALVLLLCAVPVTFALLLVFARPGRSEPTIDQTPEATRTSPAHTPPTRTATTHTSPVRTPPTRTSPAKTVQELWQWLPGEQPIVVAGYSLPGGLLYVGSGLKSVLRVGPEPALIDPKLPVNRSKPARGGEGMTYWPSYATIEPANRATYLDWLSTGRQAEVDIGYVFLFFYGLERRVVATTAEDTSLRAELPGIVAEVERLLTLYGSNAAFENYAGRFLEVCRWKLDPENWRDQTSILLAMDVPFAIRTALAQHARDARPLPPELAFASVTNGPEACRRTPVTRCTAELRALFRVRYDNAYGEGLLLKKGRGALNFEYRPASASFGGAVEFTFEGLKDAVRRGRSEELEALIEQCVEDLDSYSRWLGRRKSEPPTLSGLMLLPAELLPSHDAQPLVALRNWLASLPLATGPVVVETAELLAHCPDVADSKPTRPQGAALAVLLEKLGYGIEPDARLLGTPPSGDGVVVVFRTSRSTSAVSKDFVAASHVLHFASAIAASDGIEGAETQFLSAYVGKAGGLDDEERARLSAHLLWLLREPRTPAKLKKLAESVPEHFRPELARFLVCVAGADGQVSKKEIALLIRMGAHLGLDEKGVYSQLNELGSGSARAGEPVVVEMAPSSPAKNFSIPPKPAPAGPKPTTPEFRLDMARVEARLAESAEISAILADIFVQEEEVLPPPSVLTAEQVAGLDGAHSALMRKLSVEPSWARGDWNQLCAALGLLPDGAVDTLNEAALDACGEALLDGDDPLEVNSTVLGELLT